MGFSWVQIPKHQFGLHLKQIESFELKPRFGPWLASWFFKSWALSLPFSSTFAMSKLIDFPFQNAAMLRFSLDLPLFGLRLSSKGWFRAKIGGILAQFLASICHFFWFLKSRGSNLWLSANHRITLFQPMRVWNQTVSVYTDKVYL
jgi:hypothetical protein